MVGQTNPIGDITSTAVDEHASRHQDYSLRQANRQVEPRTDGKNIGPHCMPGDTTFGPSSEADSQLPSRAVRVLAHIHTFNDADIIDRTIETLLRQTRPVDGIL